MANNADKKEAFESRASELQKENELLLVQLHHAQEELERNYSRAQNVDTKPPVISKSSGAHAHTNASDWVADELPEMHAENHRLQALVDVQKNIHRLESTHALNARLGNILIESVDAPGSLLSVPGKLVKIWRQSTRQTPPAVLGGKDFSKVIAAWQADGFEAVEKTMGGSSVAPTMQANAYTALARHLGKEGGHANAAEAARRAYGLDPKAFRLKWLAFRLHEARDVVEAEAMLDLLPAETQFSESEARQARQLRSEAKRARENEAKQKTAFVERRAAAQMQLSNLARERDQQSKLAADRAREIEAFAQVKAKLEQEKTALMSRAESQTRLVSECTREIEALKQAKAQLQTENAALVTQCDRNEVKLREVLSASMQKSGDNDLLLATLHSVQEELEQVFAERESLQLTNAKLETQARDMEERGREIEALKHAIAHLEQDKRALESKCEEQSEIAEGRACELEALKHAKSTVVQEAQVLAVRHEIELRLADERNRELEALRQTKMLLEQEKQSLTIKHEVQSGVLAERVKELEALKQAAKQLEEEKHALATGREAQAWVVKEQTRQIELLEQAKIELELEKQVLATRQEAQAKVVEERTRQIELLKQAGGKLEQEKRVLATEQEGQAKVVEERTRQIELLKQAKIKLEQEKQVLATEQEGHAKVAEERTRQIELLKQAKVKLEQEKQVLATEREGQAKVVEERTHQIELLKQAKVKLEQEKQSLTDGRDAQTRVAEERGRELEMLKQVKVMLEKEKSELEKQKQVAIAKANKGDADIDDLMLDLELFFNGKAIIYVDIGAYVGDVFLKIKQSSKRFRIHEAHLFEPNPSSYAQLTKKIAGSDKPVVHAYNLAVGESTDTLRFIPAKSMTKALSADVQSETGPGDVFTTRCVSLDSQVSIFTDGKINLLKIDVEGKEMDVLSSARKLFESQKVDILYIEVGFNRSGTQQTYFAEIDQFLQAFGYRVLRIYEQKEEWMRDSPLLRRANIAYMSEKFADAHPLKLMQELQELKSRLNELSEGMLKSES